MGLRELRAKRGLSLQAVAVLAGLDVATISKIERGESKAHPRTIVKLAQALGISAYRMRDLLNCPDSTAA